MLGFAPLGALPLGGAPNAAETTPPPPPPPSRNVGLGWAYYWQRGRDRRLAIGPPVEGRGVAAVTLPRAVAIGATGTSGRMSARFELLVSAAAIGSTEVFGEGRSAGPRISANAIGRVALALK